MLSLRIDHLDLDRGLSELERQHLPRATAWALNDTAADVLEHMQNRMRTEFDRPTRFTLNAFMVWRAKPSALTAEVRERPSVGARHFLKVQELGGARPKTGLERLIGSRLAYEGSIIGVVPAAGARLNSFGNWSPGERNQVLSAIQAQGDSRANTTKRSAAKAKGKRAGYFVPRPGSKLSPGVWKRSGRGRISKVLHFTSASPNYDRRLGFYDGAEAVFDARFADHLRRTLSRAMSR